MREVLKPRAAFVSEFLNAAASVLIASLELRTAEMMLISMVESLDAEQVQGRRVASLAGGAPKRRVTSGADLEEKRRRAEAEAEEEEEMKRLLAQKPLDVILRDEEDVETARSAAGEVLSAYLESTAPAVRRLLERHANEPPGTLRFTASNALRDMLAACSTVAAAKVELSLRNEMDDNFELLEISGEKVAKAAETIMRNVERSTAVEDGERLANALVADLSTPEALQQLNATMKKAASALTALEANIGSHKIVTQVRKMYADFLAHDMSWAAHDLASYGRLSHVLRGLDITRLRLRFRPTTCRIIQSTSSARSSSTRSTARSSPSTKSSWHHCHGRWAITTTNLT